MRTELSRAIDTNLSGLYVTENSHRQLMRRIEGGEPVKRKMSVGLAVALSLLLVAAVAVAAVLLGGKDVVDQFIAPMAQEREGNRFTKEEVQEILAFAQEHNVHLEDWMLKALQKEDGYYKEELARLFAKQELGLQPDTWSVEDQYWYAELYMKMEPDAEPAAALPRADEMSQQQIEQAAEQYIRGMTGRTFPVLDDTQYETGRTFTAIRQNPYYILRQWHVAFRPKVPDLPRFSFNMTPQGEVTQYFSTLDVMERGTPVEKAQDMMRQFAHIYSNLQGSKDPYTQEQWQDLHNRLVAFGVTAEQAHDASRRDMAYVLKQNYLPEGEVISREQAVESALQAVSTQYQVPQDTLLKGPEDYGGMADYVYAIYLRTDAQQRWKVSFGRDYLAEVDALTGEAALVDVYSPGNDPDRRYVLDQLLPEEHRTFATPRPKISQEQVSTASQAEFFPTNLEAAPAYYWQALQDIGYNGNTATGIYTRLNVDYGVEDRYWPVLYQAMVDARNGEATPGGIFRGIPAPEDMQQEQALTLARQSLRAANEGAHEAGYLDSLKPVVQFFYNSLEPGSHAWQISFSDFDQNPMGTDIAQVVIDAKAGQVREVNFLKDTQASVEGIPHLPEVYWSTMGEDGRPKVWGHPVAPQAFWQHMEARDDTRESVEQLEREWAAQYGDNTLFWPVEAKAVVTLWRHQYHEETGQQHPAIHGIPGPGDITLEQAEALAWEQLKKAGTGKYTQEDYDSVRLNSSFIYTKDFACGRVWQIEFMDKCTNYQTSIGMVWLDATDGTVLQVDTQVGNG